jgi:glycine cleavage system H lipoate-binding protein
MSFLIFLTGLAVGAIARPVVGRVLRWADEYKPPAVLNDHGQEVGWFWRLRRRSELKNKLSDMRACTEAEEAARAKAFRESMTPGTVPK